ncbi:MAG TPA: ATP-binding protein [Chryseosolibacter sp.]|nr:ATP-binding protein [Chryseosolibacter sp.]
MNFKQYVRKGSFYAAVVEDGSDLIFIVDFDGNIHYHNSSVRGTLGYKGKGLHGKNFFDFILPAGVEDLRRRFRQSQKRAYTEKVEIQFLCKDRSYKFLEFNAINLKHKVGLSGFILDCRDITQRKRDAEELVRLQKAKEQFLANISHEIRTPINGIAGMAGLLSQDSSPDERGTYLNAIKHSAENLKVIINDILDLAAIDSGKLRFENIPFNLHDLLPSLVGMFAYQAKEKKIELGYNIQPSLNRILLGDPVRLNQILINLISNAVKFTHSGKIEIQCSAVERQKAGCVVKIQVIDTGVGVPSDKLDKIFESFSQADASVTRKYGGSGLGLTIVKQLVELQRGTIEVRSEEHKGSNFIVRIPYAFAKSHRVKKTAEPAVPLLSNRKLDGMKVLLVEDNDINRLYAKSILNQWNCNVDIAENGLVAIEKIKYNFYDVVLMDVQMPVMDGYEATRAIRIMDSHMRHAPIVALTANATKTDIEKCLSSGMNDYLPKPFTPDDLYRKIAGEMNIKVQKGTALRKMQAPAKSGFDLAYLRSISDNNRDFLQEMIDTFVQSIPPVLQEMQQSLKDENWKKLSRLAHQIKPSFSLLGMETLRKTVFYIEENADQKTNLPDVSRTTLQFIKDCTSVVTDLKAVTIA